MSSGNRDPWYAYPDRSERTYTQAEFDAAVAHEREQWEYAAAALFNARGTEAEQEALRGLRELMDRA